MELYGLTTKENSTGIVQSSMQAHKSLQSRGIIAPVEASTDCMSSMMVVKKLSGKLHIYKDPTPLNWALKRCHQLWAADSGILSGPSKSRIFMDCDVRNRLWHVSLDDESCKLKQHLVATDGCTW